MVRLIFVVLAALIGHNMPALSQDTAPEDAFAAKAKALFDYEDGVWHSRWERLDPEGNVVSEFEGTEAFTWYLGDAVVELATEIPATDTSSRALRFYNPVEKKIIFMSVDEGGDYWLMKQDVETEVVQSEPHQNPDGSEIIIRFTTLRKTDNEMDVVMHYSLDDGANWTKSAMQYMRRIESE